MRVLRVYHAGRDPAHRARERALAARGLDVTLVVPRPWLEVGSADRMSDEQFRIIEIPVSRPGDVNRHSYRGGVGELRNVVEETRPDVLDLHEEPFSVAAHEWLRAAPPELPVVVYTAQNVDKRYPPPFSFYERQAFGRAAALYPCSRQAASVARGKGFVGPVRVIPLGFDPNTFRAGSQSLDDDELTVAHVGRLVPEKGVRDAVRVLGRLNNVRPARLVVLGEGPEVAPARALADSLGVGDRLSMEPWRQPGELADVYRRAHIVLVPSTPTATWTEQFGRVIAEAQACGAVIAGYESGSIPEVGGDAALLVAPGDVEALADAVIRLSADSSDFERRREQGLVISGDRTWAKVAERQQDLYARVVGGDIEPIDLPRSPRRRRIAARAEFGPAAPTRSGTRPFALPVLRRGGTVTALLGAAIDTVLEFAARIGRS